MGAANQAVVTRFHRKRQCSAQLATRGPEMASTGLQGGGFYARPKFEGSVPPLPRESFALSRIRARSGSALCQNVPRIPANLTAVPAWGHALSSGFLPDLSRAGSLVVTRYLTCPDPFAATHTHRSSLR